MLNGFHVLSNLKFKCPSCNFLLSLETIYGFFFKTLCE